MPLKARRSPTERLFLYRVVFLNVHKKTPCRGVIGFILQILENKSLLLETMPLYFGLFPFGIQTMNFYKSRSDGGGTIYPAPKHRSSTKRNYPRRERKIT